MMSYEGFPWMSWGGTRQHQSAFRFTFRAALELHEVGWAEYPLVEFGVRGPKDLPYLMSMTGMDLTSSIMLLMDVTIIESLRIQAAAKQADEFGQPEGGLEPDAGPAGLPASSSSSINYFPPDTSLPMHVYINSFHPGEGDGSGIAISADNNEVALVAPDAYLIELQRRKMRHCKQSEMGLLAHQMARSRTASPTRFVTSKERCGASLRY